MFFNDWFDLWRIAVVGTLAYGALIVSLRISGKRSLSKWNAFDFIVTIALGSTLATVFLSKDVALAEGIFAFALLIALQFSITWLSVHSTSVQKLVKSEPTLLLDRGTFLGSALRAQRVTESEVRAACSRIGLHGARRCRCGGTRNRWQFQRHAAARRYFEVGAFRCVRRKACRLTDSPGSSFKRTCWHSA